MEQYLTVAEAARQYTLSLARLYRWIEKGLIKGYPRKYDSVTLVKKEEIERVLASMTQVEKGEE